MNSDERNELTSAIGAFVMVVAFLAFMVMASSCHGAPISVYFIAGQSNAVGFAPADDLPSYLTHQTDVIYRSTTDPVRPALEPVSGTFGPELSFGRMMADATGEKIAIVKVAYGSTSLETDWDPATGKRYGQFVARMESTLGYLAHAGWAPSVRGGIWVQGEEDASYGPLAQAYGGNLAELLAAFRSKWGPHLPVAIARINAPNRPYRDFVRDAQWVASDPLTSVWDTDDLPLMDRVHYGPEGQLRLGRRMAAAMLASRYSAERWEGGSGTSVPEPGTWKLLALLIGWAAVYQLIPCKRR